MIVDKIKTMFGEDITEETAGIFIRGLIVGYGSNYDSDLADSIRLFLMEMEKEENDDRT